MRISVCVSTKHRTDMLHQLLWSLIRQRYTDWDLVIVDDSDTPVPWESLGVYPRLFSEMGRTGHDIRIATGPRSGRIGAAYQVGFAASRPENPLFFRVDDDAWLEPDYLGRLALIMGDKSVGACGGLFLHPGQEPETLEEDDPRYRHGSIDGLSDLVNIQWFRHSTTEPIPVEHLTANVLFSRTWLERIGGFEPNLYRQHRDETQASWRLHVEGAALCVDPLAVAWHLKGANGGARGHSPDLYVNDHRTFMAQRKTMQPGIHVSLSHGIGDGLMATPMLAVLRDLNPDRNIAVYAPWASAVLDGNPAVDRMAAHPLDAQRTVRLEQSVYAWAGANRWEGHLAEAYCRMFDLPAPASLIPRLYGNFEVPAGEPPRIPDDSRYLVIAPWSTARTFDFFQVSGTKNWPADRWDKVITFAHSEGLEVVQLRGSEEEPLVPGVDHDLCGKPLRSVFACIRDAAMLVSVDTMTHHAAAALGTPSVVLWGRSKPRHFGYENDRIINLQGECPGSPVPMPVGKEGDTGPTTRTVVRERPCIHGDQWAMDQVVCPIEGHPCMAGITSDAVIEAMELLLRRTSGRFTQDDRNQRPQRTAQG
ncbi:MAG: glycosyltransferase family 9 protein [Thermodesulfobacteriota bacterium]